MGLEALHGVIYALIASLLWSLNPPVIKRYGYGISSTALNVLRFIAASLFLLMVVIFQGFNLVLSPIGLLFVVSSALIGSGIGDIAYIKCIRFLGAGRAITIGYLYVFVAQFLAILLLGENLSLSLTMGSTIAFAGIYLVFREEKYGRINLKRISIGFIPAIAWGIGSVVNKYALMYADPVSLGFIRSTILSIVLLPVSYREVKKSITSRRIVFTALITGGLGYGVGIPLFLKAVDVVGVSITVLATTLTPVLGRLFSVLLANEKINYIGIMGTGLVVLGIIVGLGLIM